MKKYFSLALLLSLSCAFIGVAQANPCTNQNWQKGEIISVKSGESFVFDIAFQTNNDVKEIASSLCETAKCNAFANKFDYGAYGDKTVYVNQPVFVKFAPYSDIKTPEEEEFFKENGYYEGDDSWQSSCNVENINFLN